MCGFVSGFPCCVNSRYFRLLLVGTDPGCQSRIHELHRVAGWGGFHQGVPGREVLPRQHHWENLRRHQQHPASRHCQDPAEGIWQQLRHKRLCSSTLEPSMVLVFLFSCFSILHPPLHISAHRRLPLPMYYVTYMHAHSWQAGIALLWWWSLLLCSWSWSWSRSHTEGDRLLRTSERGKGSPQAKVSSFTYLLAEKKSRTLEGNEGLGEESRRIPSPPTRTIGGMQSRCSSSWLWIFDHPAGMHLECQRPSWPPRTSSSRWLHWAPRITCGR